MEKEAYDLIICFNYLQRSLISDIRDGIYIGGMIVYETFIVDQARFGKPRNPDHLLKHNELLHMFRDFRCLRYHEGVIADKKAVAGIIAEKIVNAQKNQYCTMALSSMPKGSVESLLGIKPIEIKKERLADKMMFKNVLCIYPYKQELETVGFLPPIGLEYIATSIKGLVDSLKVIDLRYEDKPLSSFIDEDIDLALISYNWDVEGDFVKDTINSIPEDITVIIGGRFATENVNELFDAIPRINGIARGDGEELVKEIVQKGILPDIDGLSFRSNGRIVHNRNRSLEPARSDFFPDRRLRRYKYMVKLDKFVSDIQIDFMLGSRGCPYNCKFCDFKFNPLGEKRKWSIRTPESVVSELKTIEADVVGFADDIFTADMDWVEMLCDLIIKEGIKKKYAINARLEIAKRPDVLKKMYKAGFMAFFIGIESAYDKTLASMNKGFDTAKVREYFKVLRQFNFIYHCYFIVGNIGETKAEMFDIVKFSHELGVDTLGLSVLRATKYSPLKEMLKDYDNYHIDKESGKVFSDILSLEELQQIRRDINASFFTIPQILRVLKKLIIHRLLTVVRVYEIILFTARRKIQKLSKKKG